MSRKILNVFLSLLLIVTTVPSSINKVSAEDVTEAETTEVFVEDEQGGEESAEEVQNDNPQELIYYCDEAEHQHEQECYRDIYVLDCDLNHTHDKDCYRQLSFLVCDKKEHIHDDKCLEQDQDIEDVEESNEELTLYCDHEEHKHSFDCYGKSDNRILICDETHEHNDDCYEYEYVLVCKKDEHVHSKMCYTDPEDIEWLEEEIIEPDVIENTERKPVALARAPLRNTNTVDELEIRTFLVQFFYGATLNENDDFVWKASSSTSGHRFSYRINYAISGKFELAPESIEMRIPKQILRDREGNFADYYEMSIPSKKEIEDGEEIDMDINYAYYEDGDDIVIYNFREVYTGENGYIELSYFTSKSTFNYFDYDSDDSTDQDKSDDFYARIKVTGNGKTVEAESEHFNVHIDTGATIQSTDKRFPTKYNEWQDAWGEEPEWEAEETNGYYYLLWEIRTYINTPTQPYDFSIVDTLETEPGDFVAYRFSGQQTFSDINLATNQTINGYRYDYVLTRHPKTYWDTLDHWEITNSEIATVDPIDQVDEDTTASSSRAFIWNKPVFYKPIGRFEMHKRADGWYRTAGGSNIPLTDLNHVAAEYSRYDLDKLKEGKVEYLDSLDYAVWADGYGYPWTVDGDDMDINSYGKKPVRYELIDDKFFLVSEAYAMEHYNTMDTSGMLQLTAEDFQIDHIYYRVWSKDTEFNEGYKEIPVTYTEDDAVYFYVKTDTYENDWVNVAAKLLYDGRLIIENDIVKEFTDDKISFNDNVVAYRIVTDSKHYYTEIDAVPYTRLKNSQFVMDFIQDEESVALYNEAYANFYEDDIGFWTIIHTDEAEGDVDFLRGSKRNSHIDKKITATSNITRRKRYNINWAITMDEHYTTGTGDIENVVQSSGIFYDLLPAGSILNVSSVAVSGDKGYLNDNDYSFEQIENYNGTGQTMLIVYIDEPATNYTLYYETAHPWDSIKDWGNYIYNPVAYKTGNDDISDFNGYGNRGPAAAVNTYADIVKEETDRFIYAQTSYDISILTAAAANLHKKVKDSTDEDYSYDTWTTTNGDYSYRWRYQNTFNTKAKDLIFFDTMENYPVVDEQTGDVKTSDWRGTFKSIDLTQLRSKGIEPVVYYSSIENLDVDVDENHDLSNSEVWKVLDDSTDASTIKALAVDARKTPSGDDFILNEGDSISVIVYMKAPEAVDFHYDGEGQQYPESYNNIYLENTTIDETGGSAHFYIHQDYTTIKLVITSDIKVLKVNEENENQTIPGIKFRLFGKSDYGTEYDLIQTTGRNGRLVFKDIEMGEYILQEYEGNDDWQEDHTEYFVKIDENRVVTINGVPVDSLEYYKITNKPRVHGDLRLQKRREGTGISETHNYKVGDTIKVSGQEYEIMKLGEGTIVYLREKFPDYEYPVLEDDGNPRSGIGTTHFSNLQYNWRITSGGELIIGKEGEYQYIGNWNESDYPWYKDPSVVAVRFEGTVGLSNDINFLNNLPNLEYVDFSNCRTNDVTFPHAMLRRTKIKYVKLGDDFNGGELRSIRYMFYDCQTIEYVEFPENFKQAKIEEMEGIFMDCKNLKIVDLTNLNTTKLMDIYEAFKGCSNLQKIYVGEDWNTSGLDNYHWEAFEGCYSLTNYEETDGRAQYMEKASTPGEGYLSVYMEYDLAMPTVPVSDTTFKLSGISDYGNEVMQIMTTDSNGMLEFVNIEKGTYELREIKENSDYVLNQTVWTVVVDDSGNAVLLEPENEELRDRLYQVDKAGKDTYAVYNEPRYWGFTLRKVDKENETIWLEGATFTLTGVSDLGTEYNEEAVSDQNGRVVFNRIEKGTYVLTETAAPTGVDDTGKQGGNRNYIADPAQHIVTIDEQGTVTIDGLKQNDYGDFVVKDDRQYDGKITVVKIWNDGLTDEEAANRPVPVLHLTTTDPDSVRYSVVYNANGGLYDDYSTINTLIYKTEKVKEEGDSTSSDTLIEGSVKTPKLDGHSFLGWYLDPECTNEYDPNIYYGKTTIVYAKWKQTEAYAVYDSVDKTLIFFRDDPGKYSNKQIIGNKTYYAGMETDTYSWQNIPPWCTDYTDDKVRVEFVDTIKPVSIALWFYNMNKLENIIGIEKLDTSEVTSMANTFYRCELQNPVDISTFDTSKVIDMSHMFCIAKNVRGYENFNTSNVTDMNSMFFEFDSEFIDLSRWDTSNVTNMYAMFASNKVVKVIDMSGCDTSNVTGMQTMFYYAENLETIYVSEKWDTSNVRNIQEQYSHMWMFTNDRKLPNYRNDQDDLKYAHYGPGGYLTYKEAPTASLQSNDNVMAVPDKPADTSKDKSILEILGLVRVVHAEEGDVVASGTQYGMSYSVIDLGDGTYELQLGKEGQTEYFTRIGQEYYTRPWYLYTDTISKVTFVGDVVATGDMTELFSDMAKCQSYDLQKFNTENVTKTYNMFSGNRVLETLDLTNFSTKNVENMFGMFQTCYKLNKIIGLENLDVGNAKDITALFYMTDLKSVDISSWDLKNVERITHLIYLSSVTEIVGLRDLYLPNLKDATGMFAGSKMEKIDLSGWKTGKLESTEELFYSCRNLTEVNLTGLYGVDEIVARDMFNTCPNIQKIVLNDRLYTTTSDNVPFYKDDRHYLQGDDWVRVRDINGNLTYDETQFTGKQVESLTEETTPVSSGTWIRKSSPMYDIEYEDVEYISEQGINANNHWTKLDDGTWTYTFDVFDDTLTYYLYEEYIDGYDSDVMYPMYMILDGSQTKSVTISNNKSRGNLLIRKTVENGGDTDLKFEFTVTLTGEGISGRQIFSGVVFTDGKATIKLGHNESKLIENLPADITYTVEEKAVANYVSSGIQNGTIRDGEVSEASFTNRYEPPVIEPVDLTIRKVVTGNVTSDEEYTINIVLTSLDHDKTYHLSNGDSFTSGSSGDGYVSVKLKGGQEVKLLDLPVGATYQAVEAAGNYISSFEIKDNNGVSKIVRSSQANTASNTDLSTAQEKADQNEDVVITYTNEINKYQDLSLTKYVISENDLGKDFEFSIELTGLVPNGRYDSSIGRLIADADGYIQKDITLKKDEKIEFFDLPVGAGYSIKEADYSKDGFSVEIVSNNNGDTIVTRNINGKIVEDTDAAIVFTNIKKKVISGNKTWIDDGVLHDNSAEVKLILKRKIEGGEFEVLDVEPEWQRNKYYFYDLDIEDGEGNRYIYEVKEVDIEDYSEKVEYDSENDSYDLINTKDYGKFTLRKKVDGNRADLQKKFKFTITLTNSEGKPLSGTFSGVEFVEGKAEVYLKHNEVKMIETYVGVSYVIEEDPEDYVCDTKSVSGTVDTEEKEHEFINVLQVDEGDLKIRKVVSGKNGDRKKEFRFTITLSDKSINGTYGDVEFVNGVAEFTLKHDETKLIKALPAGISYEVVEDDYHADKYRTYSENMSGVIKADTLITCTYTNYKEEERPPYEPPKTGS